MADPMAHSWIVQAVEVGRVDWAAWNGRRVIAGCAPDLESAKAAAMLAPSLMKVLDG